MTLKTIDLNFVGYDFAETEEPGEVGAPDTSGVSDLSHPNSGGEPTGSPLRRRIIAVSEGRHNGINFDADAIRYLVEQARAEKLAEGDYDVPLVLDHQANVLNMVGETKDIEFKETVTVRGKTVKNAAVASVEYWEHTPMLKEVSGRVRKAPRKVKYSVRVKGDVQRDASTGQLRISKPMLIHIAPVLEPADKNAGEIGLGEADSSDVGLNKSGKNDFSMTGEQETISDLTATLKLRDREIAELSEKVANAEARIASLEKEKADLAESIMPRATLLASVLAFPDVNKDFVTSLSNEQLEMYRNDLMAKQEAAKKAAEEEAAKKAEEEAAAKAEAEKRALEEAEKKSRQNYNAFGDGINLSDKGQAGQTGTDLSEAEIEKAAMEIFGPLPEY
ncbi:MAG TPA: hypothetical protein PKH75_09790 [Bacillota bacterium]|nr:hypothetical protein [Bacillota bacterium]